jgi:hypothetical protein
MAGHDVVVVGAREDPYEGQAWRCALALDGRIAPRLGDLQVVRVADLARLSHPPRGPLVVLAGEPIEERALVAAFGRGPAETTVRQPSAGEHGLRVVYMFPPV